MSLTKYRICSEAVIIHPSCVDVPIDASARVSAVVASDRARCPDGRMYPLAIRRADSLTGIVSPGMMPTDPLHRVEGGPPCVPIRNGRYFTHQTYPHYFPTTAGVIELASAVHAVDCAAAGVHVDGVLTTSYPSAALTSAASEGTAGSFCGLLVVQGMTQRRVVSPGPVEAGAGPRHVQPAGACVGVAPTWLIVSAQHGTGPSLVYRSLTTPSPQTAAISLPVLCCAEPVSQVLSYSTRQRKELVSIHISSVRPKAALQTFANDEYQREGGSMPKQAARAEVLRRMFEDAAISMHTECILWKPASMIVAQRDLRFYIEIGAFLAEEIDHMELNDVALIRHGRLNKFRVRRGREIEQRRQELIAKWGTRATPYLLPGSDYESEVA